MLKNMINVKLCFFVKRIFCSRFFVVDSLGGPSEKFFFANWYSLDLMEESGAFENNVSDSLSLLSVCKHFRHSKVASKKAKSTINTSINSKIERSFYRNFNHLPTLHSKSPQKPIKRKLNLLHFTAHLRIDHIAQIASILFDTQSLPTQHPKKRKRKIRKEKPTNDNFWKHYFSVIYLYLSIL